MKSFNLVLTYNLIPADIQPGMEQNDSGFADYDDTYAEWDTNETVFAIRDALSINHNVHLIEADKEAYEKIKAISPDIVFNVAEGKNGISREAQIPAMLDMLNIPYTGSDPLTLSLCLDKARTKEVLSYHNIPTPKFKRISSEEEFKPDTFNFPVLIKPVGEGSSKGIYNNSIIDSPGSVNGTIKEALNKYNQDLIVEEYLPGKEFTVALMGNGDETIVFPIVEINFDGLPEGLKPIYSFEAKWLFDSPNNPLEIFSCPAEIDESLKLEIEKVALKSYKTLNCRDWSRIDIRLDSNGKPKIIEVNPLPGVLPDPKNNSCYPKAARTYGMTYDEMINKVLYFAAKRSDLLK